MRCRFQTIIFDLDGTLVNTATDLLSAINQALDKMHLPVFPEENIKQIIGPGKEAFIRAVLPEHALEQENHFLTLFRTYYWDHCLDQTTLFPGMDRVLDFLEACSLAVASNKPRFFVDRILKGLKVKNRFKCVIGPEDVIHAKPHPEMIIQILKQINGNPASTLMIGDTDKDIQSGRGAGVQTCGARYGYGDIQEMLKMNPDFVINHPLEIIDIQKNHHKANGKN